MSRQTTWTWNPYHEVVQTTANRIMEILPDGSLIDKRTTYDEYLESDQMARRRTVYETSADDEADDLIMRCILQLYDHCFTFVCYHLL